MADIRLTVWNEFRHEKKNEKVKSLYPDGMHEAIASYMRKQPGVEVKTATLDEPEHGLTQEVLDATDVLTWWGHTAHGAVSDEVVDRVQKRVLGGMGIIILHSGHFSKIFRRLMGTSCGLTWREVGEKERLWVVNPSHPITKDLGAFIELPHTEMYGECFDVPDPDELLFVSWFEGGEVFRSGMTWHRGRGKVFYFRPGHETLPIFHNEEILGVIERGVRWAAPTANMNVEGVVECVHRKEPLESIGKRPHHQNSKDTK